MDFIAKRRSKPGPENDMVQLFLSRYEFLFEHDSELSLTVLTEPKIGISFPDIVLVYWDRSMLVNWTETRQNLAIKDIKILHHIAQKEKNHIRQIQKKLGFSEKEIFQSLSALQDADLLYWTDSHVSIKPLSEIFFVKDIIAIEAKMRDWKSVIEQANLNKLFASQSYVLVPKINDNSIIMSETSRLRLGCLEYDDNKFMVSKKAKRNNIPVSYNSWIINEAIGRDNYGF